VYEPPSERENLTVTLSAFGRAFFQAVPRSHRNRQRRDGAGGALIMGVWILQARSAAKSTQRLGRDPRSVKLGTITIPAPGNMRCRWLDAERPSRFFRAGGYKRFVGFSVEPGLHEHTDPLDKLIMYLKQELAIPPRGVWNDANCRPTRR